jgi:hypothetical protein
MECLNHSTRAYLSSESGLQSSSISSPFEEWISPWQAGGHPVDRLPLLRSWDR